MIKREFFPVIVAPDFSPAKCGGEFLFSLKPDMVTAMCAAGEEGINALKKTLHPSTKLIRVTKLTSKGGENSLDRVLRLAEKGSRGGVDGFTCSVHEVSRLREQYPDKILIVPSVRSPDAVIAEDDQKRTGTFRQAFIDGADYCISGRQIIRNEYPLQELRRIYEEEISLVLGQ
ncbi:orotidine 5'-phosphate decarboxylase [bacterium]|nr:orotidine 5'-phosphate decarboxylase [bacterium]